MKRIYKGVAAVALLLALCPSRSNAQTSADLVLSGAPNLAVYPGFVTSGTFNVTFSNSTGQVLPAQSFVIILSLPTGFEFDATYPACPAGWQYTRQAGNLSINLKPLVSVASGIPAGVQAFQVPFKTTAALTNQPYLGQIQIISPAFTDPNTSNNTPQGTVSVANTPLPVSFEQFSAVAKGCSTEIAWKTGQEKNNKYFSVDRSTDGVRFESIGKIDAKGDAGTGASYSFTDSKPANGKNFYRIAQFDNDGKSATSNTLSVTFNCSEGKIELYPNPATETIHIKGLSGKNTIKIFNAVGQLMIEETTEDLVHPMQLTALASGVYQVQVSNNSVTLFTGKFIKDKK